jgi:hypothetical protein
MGLKNRTKSKLFQISDLGGEKCIHVHGVDLREGVLPIYFLGCHVGVKIQIFLHKFPPKKLGGGGRGGGV